MHKRKRIEKPHFTFRVLEQIVYIYIFEGSICMVCKFFDLHTCVSQDE